MIHEFGSYHKVFWNCQAFAKCYFPVVTGKVEAKFDDWTSTYTSRLFLCAFLVGAPFATTNKVKENRCMEKLVKQIESIPADLSTVDRSGRAIKAMYATLRRDPS
jgi:glucosamine 6-phosphate synthetase-like amidotransferase/phosphosugar isomerase protein